jgi:cytochrome c oxidase subunit 2
MKLVIALVLLTAGSVVFHFVSPWWFTPLASNWSDIDDTINITFWVTGAVFVAVNFFLAYCVYRFRYQKGQRSHYEPENKKLELWLTAITSLGVILMLAPGLSVWAKFVDVPEDAKQVEVLGQQWQWGFRFPGEDGELGKVDALFISQTNPFGLDPNDVKGQDDVIVNDNEVHLPINQNYKALLRSKDVLHNFAIPQFRVKMDLVPGIVTYLWFEATKLGRFDILCMELCGIAHHTMRGQMVIDSEEGFRQWLNQQPTFRETQEGKPGDLATGKNLYAVCASCHGQQGQGNLAMNAPALSGQADWYLTRQLQYYQEGIRGSHKDDVFGQQMAAMAATLASPQAIKDVVAYIDSLPASKPSATLKGDADRGESYFVTCGACHGSKGEGNFALSAPKLTGQQDWYVKRQINHFRQGIRGEHVDDNYGKQMILMAKMLKDEQAINDLLAHLNTLNHEAPPRQP